MPSYLRHPLFKFITSIIATQNQTIQDDRSNRQINKQTTKLKLTNVKKQVLKQKVDAKAFKI